MSLLFYDGFDNYTYLPLKWDEYTNFSQFCIKPDVGRKGSSALCALSGYTTISEYIGKILPTDQSDIIIGFAFKKVDPDYGYIEIAFLYDEVIQSSVRLFNTNFYWIRVNNFLFFISRLKLQIKIIFTKNIYKIAQFINNFIIVFLCSIIIIF